MNYHEMNHFRLQVMLILFLVVLSTLVQGQAASAGYEIVDREGRVLNKDADRPVEVGASDRNIIFKNRGGSKVFEAEWDASGDMLVVKGDNIYIRIHRSGKIEKLTTMQQGDEGQYPAVIQPVIPVFPRRTPATPAPAPQPRTPTSP